MNSKHDFSDNYNKRKKALVAALEDRRIEKEEKHKRILLPQRIICIAAVAILLTLSVCAATMLVDFSISHDDNNVSIHAGLVQPADPDDPLRAWNPDKDEISVKLVFGYMPEDITKDKSAAGKWGGADNSRGISFSGYDLRQSDLDNIIGNADSAESFMAGKNMAYIIRDASEAELYNKRYYVLFEEEDMVIKATVTFGISETEMKRILSEMRIEETDDIMSAIPIANEDRSDVKLDGIIEAAKPFITYDALYNIGDSAHYIFGPQDEYHKYPWTKYTITVEGYEIRDSLNGLSESAIERKDVVDRFTDGKGNFIPYKRTELLIDENNVKSFGETVEMTKRLVLVTVKIEDFYDKNGDSPRLFLRSYSLYDFVKNDDGTVKRYGREGGFVIDRTPGTHAEVNEPIYIEDLGGGYYRLGYILDTDQLGGELLLTGYTPNIHYVLK